MMYLFFKETATTKCYTLPLHATLPTCMLGRPVGGAGLALLRLDASRARYYAATEVGRVRGYLAVSRSKSSA